MPALRGLRRARPGSLLVLAGPPGPGELLRRRGVVDGVLPVEGVRALDDGAVVAALREHPGVLPPGRCVELAVNLHGRGPQSVHALRVVLAERGTAGAVLLAHRCPAAGLDDGPTWDGGTHEVDRWCALVATGGGACSSADLVLPAGAREVPAALVSGDRPARPVVLHPGAASGARCWPARRWADLAAALLDHGQDVVLTGSPDEAPQTAQVRGLVTTSSGPERLVDLAGRCDLEQLASVVAGARALVCGDTGVAHLATALRTPSVLLFGPTPPGAWGPRADEEVHRVLWPAPDPAYRGDPHAAVTDPVLARTTVADVLAALRSLPPRPGP